jgi:hypothetical protein
MILLGYAPIQWLFYLKKEGVSCAPEVCRVDGDRCELNMAQRQMVRLRIAGVEQPVDQAAARVRLVAVDGACSQCSAENGGRF